MKLRTLAALAALSLFAGCDTEPEVVHTGLPPTDPAKIVIIKRAPSEPYKELGMISDIEVYYPPGSTSTHLASSVGETADPQEKLREKAGAMGADAIILKDRGLIAPIDTSTGSTHIYIKGMAIKFTQPAPGMPPPPPAPPNP